MLLISDTGLTRSDIRGERSVTQSVRDVPQWRAVVDEVNTPVTRGAVAVSAGIGALLVLMASTVSGAVVSILLTVLYAALSQIGTAEPAQETTVSETPGMTDQEVWEALIINDENEQYKEEKADEERRKAQREA